MARSCRLGLGHRGPYRAHVFPRVTWSREMACSTGAPRSHAAAPPGLRLEARAWGQHLSNGFELRAGEWAKGAARAFYRAVTWSRMALRTRCSEKWSSWASRPAKLLAPLVLMSSSPRASSPARRPPPPPPPPPRRRRPPRRWPGTRAAPPTYLCRPRPLRPWRRAGYYRLCDADYAWPAIRCRLGPIRRALWDERVTHRGAARMARWQSPMAASELSNSSAWGKGGKGGWAKKRLFRRNDAITHCVPHRSRAAGCATGERHRRWSLDAMS